MNFKDSLVASLVPIFLGFGFVIAKPAFESFPPILLMGLRFIFAASILIWWFPIPKGFLKKIFIASFIANTLQYSITYTGLNFIDIGIICKNKLIMIDFLNFLFFSDLKTLLITSISADLFRFNWNFSYFITLKIDKNRFFLSNML